jgi:TolA-binding protein
MRRTPHPGGLTRWLLAGVLALAALQAGDGRALAQAGTDLAAAQAAYDRGDYDTAAGRYAAFSRSYPADPGLSLAVFRLGQCLYHMGRYAQAAMYFDRTIRQYPSSPEAEVAWLWVGDSRLQVSQYPEALASYDSLLERYPNSAYAGRAAFWRAEVLQRMGRAQDSLAAYQDALARTLTPDEAAYACYAVGWGYTQLGKAAEGRPFLERVSRDYPTSAVAAEAGYLLGTSWQAANDTARARAAYEQVVRQHPQSPHAAWAQLGLGSCALREERYEEALAAFRAVRERYPEREAAGEALAREADCLFHLSRWAEAAAIYEQVAQVTGSPAVPEALYWLGVCEVHAGAEDKARTALGRLVREFPADTRVPDANLRLGWLQVAAGDAAAAAESFAAAAGGDDAERRGRAELGLAWAAVLQEPSAEHLAAAEKALGAHAEAPEAPELAARLAQAFLGAGQAERALALVQGLLARPGAEPALRVLAAACQLSLGHAAEAEALYRQALAESKDAAVVRECTVALVGLAAGKGDVDGARALLSELDRQEADAATRAVTLNQVADALSRAGQAAQAAALYERSLAAQATGDVAAAAQAGLAWSRLQAGDTTGAAAAFEALSRQYPGSPAAAQVPAGLLATAEALYAKVSYAEAAALYRGVLEAHPGSPEAISASYKLAWALLQQGKPDEALAPFLRTVEGGQGDVAADARYQAARVLYERGEPERCAPLLEPFLKDLASAPQAPWALVLLGRAQADLGRTDLALAALGRVTGNPAGSPATESAWAVTARVLRENHDLDGAEAAARQALESTDPRTRMEAQHELASCYRNRGDYARAADEFLKAALDYTDETWCARALYAAGQCYEDLRDPVKAASTYQALTERYPDQAEWVGRAQVRLKVLDG